MFTFIMHIAIIWSALYIATMLFGYSHKAIEAKMYLGAMVIRTIAFCISSMGVLYIMSFFNWILK